MRIALIRTLLSVALVALGALATGDVALAAPPGFTTVKLQGAADRTEPRVAVDPNDTRWVITNDASTGDAIVYFSNDAGRTWQRTASEPADQSIATIDTDIVAMHTGRIFASELDLAGTSRVPAVLLLLASAASSKTIGLIITFGGIGVIVNGLIVYIIVQLLGERAENQERMRRSDLGPRRG